MNIDKASWLQALRSATVAHISCSDHVGVIMSHELRGKALQDMIAAFERCNCDELEPAASERQP